MIKRIIIIIIMKNAVCELTSCEKVADIDRAVLVQVEFGVFACCRRSLSDESTDSVNICVVGLSVAVDIAAGDLGNCFLDLFSSR